MEEMISQADEITSFSSLTTLRDNHDFCARYGADRALHDNNNFSRTLFLTTTSCLCNNSYYVSSFVYNNNNIDINQQIKTKNLFHISKSFIF